MPERNKSFDQRNKSFDLSKITSTDDPEVVDFRQGVEELSTKFSESLETTGENKDILRELINNPDSLLEKTSSLIGDESVDQEELDKFIEKITNILEFTRLQKETSQELIVLQAEKDKDNYPVKEKENELQMLSDRIVENTKKLSNYGNILKKLK